jgi:hypothetical protein
VGGAQWIFDSLSTTSRRGHTVELVNPVALGSNLPGGGKVAAMLKQSLGVAEACFITAAVSTAGNHLHKLCSKKKSNLLSVQQKRL